MCDFLCHFYAIITVQTKHGTLCYSSYDIEKSISFISSDLTLFAETDILMCLPCVLICRCSCRINILTLTVNVCFQVLFLEAWLLSKLHVRFLDPCSSVQFTNTPFISTKGPSSLSWQEWSSYL